MAPIQNVLVAVDLSSCSRAALEFACRLAAPLRARIEVLFVLPSVSAAGSSGGAASELGAAQEELHRFVTSMPVAVTGGVNLSERVVAGDARERIVGTAESSGYDLVVLGTHGRSGRPRSLAGSVAESVVRTSACPVLTVRER